MDTTKTETRTFKITLIVRQKHGVLFQAIKARGWSGVQLGQYLEIDHKAACRLLSLQYIPPVDKWPAQKRKHFLEKIMELTGQTFDELFPAEIRTKNFLNRTKVAEVEADVPLDNLLPEPTEELFLPPPQYNSADQSTMIEALSELEPREKDALEMRYFKDMTYSEIGERLGLSLERARGICLTAEHHLSQKLLRENMSPLDPEHPESVIAKLRRYGFIREPFR